MMSVVRASPAHAGSGTRSPSSSTSDMSASESSGVTLLCLEPARDVGAVAGTSIAKAEPLSADSCDGSADVDDEWRSVCGFLLPQPKREEEVDGEGSFLAFALTYVALSVVKMDVRESVAATPLGNTTCGAAKGQTCA